VKTSSRPRRRPRSEDDDADEEEEEDDNHSVLSGGGPYPDMDQEVEEGERITGDLEGDEDSEDPFFCPHCSSSFPSPSLLKAHIEEEHVLKLLERQLLQYQSMSGMKSQSTNGQQLDIPVDPQQLMATLAAASRGGHPPHHLLQRQQPNQQQRPPSRTSSRSSSGSNPPESPRKSSFDQSGLRGMDIAGFPFPIPGPSPGHDGKGLPIGMFPNPMAPFLFPVLPPGHPGAGAGGQRSPGSSSGPPGNFGIFNPEAYCDICNKEFCNKYFLKTHKANKHGIYTDGVPPPTSSTSSSSSSSTPSVTTISGSGSGGGGGQFNPSAVSAAAAAASAFFPAGLNSSSIGNQGAVPDGPLQQLHQQQLAASMAARIMGTVSNPESWCEICQKEFCNKYFLKKHKQKIHGIEISGGSTSGQPGSSQASNDGSLSDGSGKAPPSPMTPPPPPSSSHSQQPQSTPVNMTTTTATNGESGGSSNRTTLEGLDAFVYCSKFFIGNKGGGNTNSNNVGNQNLPPSSSSPKSSRDQQQHLFELAMSQQPTTKVNGQASHHSITSPPTSLSGNIPNNLPISQSFSSTNTLPPPPPPPQPNTINSPKNYCNICNKELCNKYFMKTHMLKMHGINIDEQPAEAAVSSTIGGVTCDICQKELCSKYFLKVHKQNTHGIYEESGNKESSGGRRGNSSSSQSVRTSQLEQPSWSQQQDSTSNDGQTNDFQRGERSSSDKESSAKGIDPKDTGNRYFSHYTEVCPLCERRFKSIKWLQTHLKNDHMERGQQPPFLDGDHQPQHLQHVQGVPSSLPPGLPPGLLPMFPDPEAALNFVMSASKSGNVPSGIVPNQMLGQQQFLKKERESPKGVDNTNCTSPPVSIAALKWLKSHISSPEEGRPQSTSGQPDEEPNRVKEQQPRESVSPSKNSTINSTSISHPLPTAYAIPQKPTAGPFIMQPFLICSQQSEENSSTGSKDSKSSTLGDTFVPSLVYLPVSKKIVQPVTVAFQLTPA